MLGETRETSRGLVVSIGTPHLSFGMTTMLVRGPLDLGVMSFRKVDDIAAELNSDLIPQFSHAFHPALLQNSLASERYYHRFLKFRDRGFSQRSAITGWRGTKGRCAVGIYIGMLPVNTWNLYYYRTENFASRT